MKRFLSYLMGMVSILLQATLTMLWCWGLYAGAFRTTLAYSTVRLMDGNVYFLSLLCLFAGGLMVWWGGSNGLIGAWNKKEQDLNQKWFG